MSLARWNEEEEREGAHLIQQLLRMTARILRDGIDFIIPADELVPGNIVFIGSSGRVPAGEDLPAASILSMNESLLTREGIYAGKDAEPLPGNTLMGDRRNMALASSAVAVGRGTGVAISTGSGAEIGLIAGAVSATEASKPPAHKV